MTINDARHVLLSLRDNIRTYDRDQSTMRNDVRAALIKRIVEVQDNLPGIMTSFILVKDIADMCAKYANESHRVLRHYEKTYANPQPLCCIVL